MGVAASASTSTSDEQREWSIGILEWSIAIPEWSIGISAEFGAMGSCSELSAGLCSSTDVA